MINLIDWTRPWYASIKTKAEIIVNYGAPETNHHSARPELAEGFLHVDGVLRQAHHERNFVYWITNYIV